MTIYENENEIADAMDQVAYGVHAEPDEKYDKDDKYTGEDDEINDHDFGDDNKGPDETRGQPQPLLYVKYRNGINMEHNAEKGEQGVVNLLGVKIEDDISSDKITVKSQNIEHQQTSDDKSLP